MNRLFLITILVLLFCFSCNRKTQLDITLDLSDTNKNELQQVIKHYSKRKEDTQKLKAARFLIENIPVHFAAISNENLYQIADSLNKSNINLNELIEQQKRLRKKMTPFVPHIMRDMKKLSADFLIKHIDKSIEIWQKSPWYNPNRWDDFCEYILPYSVGTEKRELWIDYYENKYSHYLKEMPADSSSIDRFCDWLNGKLIENGKMVLNHEMLNQDSPLMLDHIKAGTCDNYGARTIFIMRSLGMPVCMDFSPQWSGYTLTHSWNTLIGEEGKIYPFMGFDETIVQWKIPENFHCSKVFRKTYSIQKESLAARGLSKSLPDFLQSPTIKDVTNQYTQAHDIEVSLQKENPDNSKVAYLCVFKNEWNVAGWGEIKYGKARFKSMGWGVMYLPAYYQSGYGFQQAGDPFFIDSLGIKKAYSILPGKKQKMILKRKYPYSVKTGTFVRRMLKGKFQGADNPDFTNPVNLHIINDLPETVFNTLLINENKKFRYVRYHGAPGSHTNVAEIEFYSSPSDMDRSLMLQGKIIGTDNDHKIDGRGHDLKNVFDGNVLSFFNTTYDTPGWVGLDLGKPVDIKKIRFLPRNDDNNIRIGDTYELVYWQNNKWNTLGTKIADSESLLYENCPVNTIFMLHNHSRGKEERIFTYEKGEQVWW